MKSQVKLLFIITQGFWGGAQKYVLDLATSLSPEYDVNIAVGAEDADTFKKKLPPHVVLYPLKHLTREISPLHDMLALREIKKLYQKLQPDIVHLNSTKAGVLGSLAKTKNVKIVYTAHGWVFLEPLSPLRKNLYRLAEKYTASKKDAIIVLSPQDKQVAEQQLHIDHTKLSTIPIGISEISFFTREVAREKITTINPHINTKQMWALTIANHYPTKGLDILIDAIRQLSPAEQNNFQFCIIGSGPERTRLQTDINILHLEKTVFLIPYLENAAEYLKAADLFVLPSRKEGLPYVILEALQAGIPLIATNVGGIPTLLENIEQATLIPSENSFALTQALQNFLLSSHNFQTPSVHNKNVNPQYTLAHMVQETKNLYRTLTE